MLLLGKLCIVAMIILFENRIATSNFPNKPPMKTDKFSQVMSAICDEDEAPSIVEPDKISLPRMYEHINFDWAGTDHQKTSKLYNKRSEYPNSMSSIALEKELLGLQLYPPSCACQTKYELFDLGYANFPRYLLNAVCVNRDINSSKCWLGSKCKEIPYNVRVLTQRSDNENIHSDKLAHLLPDDLRYSWKFETKTAAACQCAL